MKITHIPFNAFLAISQSETDAQLLELEFADNLKNHLGTFHAGAQFALAEACSGLALQRQFPHLDGMVLPVLRRAEVKYKKPAQSAICAKAEIGGEEVGRFEEQLARKGRAGILVPVEIVDQEGTVTMTGIYEWFIQKV